MKSEQTTPWSLVVIVGFTCRWPSQRIRRQGIGCEASWKRWTHEVHTLAVPGRIFVLPVVLITTLPMVFVVFNSVVAVVAVLFNCVFNYVFSVLPVTPLTTLPVSPLTLFVIIVPSVSQVPIAACTPLARPALFHLFDDPVMA